MTSHSLQQLNSLGLPARCNRLFTLSQLDDLSALAEQLVGHDRIWILGEGTNTVFSDDFDGLVIRMACKGIQVSDDDEAYRLHVLAGENWHDLVCFCLEQDMPGLENLALIPGSVGAAPIQNIGAYGSQFSDFCDYVDVLDLANGEVFRLSAEDCQFAYRESIFKQPEQQHWLILGVGISLPKVWSANVSYAPLSYQEFSGPRDIFDEVVKIRQQKLPDPKVIGNVGSFFKNPVVSAEKFMQLAEQFPSIVSFAQEDGSIKLAAAWLIDSIGAKTFRIGGAAVHQQQALVLINQDSASAEDIIELGRQIYQQVDELYGVKLEAEARIVGRHGEIKLFGMGND